MARYGLPGGVRPVIPVKVEISGLPAADVYLGTGHDHPASVSVITLDVLHQAASAPVGLPSPSATLAPWSGFPSRN